MSELRRGMAENSANGSALTLLGVQRDRPSLYEMEEQLNAIETPVLIIVGDEDDVCLDASLFLKRALAASDLAILPTTGHTVNLEEAIKFNALCEEFLHKVEADQATARDHRSLLQNAFGMR